MIDDEIPDFRYFAEDAKIPWAAIGEEYNPDDILAVLRFLMQGQGGNYEAAFAHVEDGVRALAKHSSPPPKLSLGENVRKLEEEMAAYLGVPSCLFVTNGTAGIELGYRFANLQPGDEVIAPVNTFIATIAYPLAIGARVVFADVDPVTLNLDPADVARKVTDRTKVVIPVHLGGWPVDMDPLMDIAATHDLIVIEDAVQAFGAEYKGRKVGTIGHFGVFGFHESENITSFGEGGLLIAQEPYSAELKQARFLGLDVSRPIDNWVYDVVALSGKHGPAVAHHSSTTEIQALGLRQQLPRATQVADQRRRNAAYLSDRFAENDALIPQPIDGPESDVRSVHHLYLLQLDPARAGGDMTTLRHRLTELGITNVPHFAPLYRFELLRELGYDQIELAASCPVMEEAFNHRFTHIPLHPLSESELQLLADTVLEAVNEMQSQSLDGASSRG